MPVVQGVTTVQFDLCDAHCSSCDLRLCGAPTRVLRRSHVLRAAVITLVCLCVTGSDAFLGASFGRLAPVWQTHRLHLASCMSHHSLVCRDASDDVLWGALALTCSKYTAGTGR